MEYFSWFVCVSSSNVFHVFWLHVLPNYCNLILKQEWPNPLLYCRNPASETLVINLACFNRDWESSAVTAEGRPPWEAPLVSLYANSCEETAEATRRKLEEVVEGRKQKSLGFFYVVFSVSWLSPERYRLCEEVCEGQLLHPHSLPASIKQHYSRSAFVLWAVSPLWRPVCRCTKAYNKVWS